MKPFFKFLFNFSLMLILILIAKLVANFPLENGLYIILFSFPLGAFCYFIDKHVWNTS